MLPAVHSLLNLPCAAPPGRLNTHSTRCWRCVQYVLDLLLRFPPYFGSRAREHDYISKDSVEGKCRLEPESRVSSAEHAQDHARDAATSEPSVTFITPAFLF